MGRVQQACFALLALLFTLPAWADKPAPLSAQTLKMPSGPASLKGLGESFEANPGTGTGSYSIPIELPPGFLVPPLSLNYTGGTGRGEVGVGFQLPVLQIYRLTDKGAPKFDETDRFAVTGPGLNEELVLADPVKRVYRLKNEGSFVLFLRDSATDSWTVLFPKGQRSVLGATSAARTLANGKTARWFISSTLDLFNHQLSYRYFTDQGKVYWQGADYQQEVTDPAYKNHVELAYESRPDVIRDFRYSDLSLTAQRLKTISVYQGTRLLRKYTLTYAQQALWSLLSTVTMEGENGLTMPTLTLSYVQPTSRSGRFVRTEGFASLTGFDTGRMTLEDVTGDGLPDLLNGNSSNYSYFENIDGQRFSGNAISLGVSGSPDRNLDDPGVVMADVDGDGWRDVWYPTGDGRFRYFPGGKIDHGRFLGFGAAQLMNGNNVVSDVTKPELRLTDLNGDGRTDLLYQRPGLGDAWVENQLGKDLIQRSIPTLPAGVVLSSTGLELQDFNGDGFLDLVLKEFDSGKHDLVVWYGIGSGKFWPTAQTINAPQASAKEVFLSDVDRDGQTDLIRVSGTWVAYYLNDGSGTLQAQQADFYGMPETSQTKRILMADMNGNGTSDVVWLTVDGKLSYLDLIEDPAVGLMSRIDNGMGRVTEISYRCSTDYAVTAKVKNARWATPLPHPVNVIAETSVRDSLEKLGVDGWESRVSHEYADGYYDGKEREFRGFAAETSTTWGDAYQEGSVDELHMHVGRNLSTGADEEALKGKVWLEAQRTDSGAVLKSTEARWEQRWLCQEDIASAGAILLPSCTGIADKSARKDEMVGLAAQTATLSGEWERQSSPRYSARSTTYDAWGNVTRLDNYGEVVFSAGHNLGDAWSIASLNTAVGADERFIESDFANVIDVAAKRWLIGFATEARIKTGAGSLISKTQTLYDGAPLVGLAVGQLSQGQVTATLAWLAEEGRWIPSERYARNADGLPTQVLDPTGVSQSLVYDSKTKFFPVEERLVLEESRTALFTASYDTGLGEMTGLTDPNGQSTYFRYDGLGRLVKVIDPLGSDQRPLTTYAYEYGTPNAPISKTVSSQLVDRTAGTYRTSISYSDGLGRLRLKKEQSEQGYVASSWHTLSPLGNTQRAFAPFSSTTTAFETSTDLDASTLTYSDALGRTVRQDLPVTQEQGASFRSFEFRPFEARAYDERDSTEGTRAFPATTRVDGLGRVTTVQRVNSVAGQTVLLNWNFAYDAVDHVKSFTDPKGLQRSYSYDSLGRLRGLSDPNLGSVTYGYDDAGRLTLRADGLGQQVRREYGISGRPSREQLLSTNAQGTLQVDSEHRFHFDAAQPGGPLPGATNLVGQISWVEFPVGSAHYSYDEAGRTVTESAVLWDGVSPFSAQTRTTHTAKLTYDAAGQRVGAELPGGFVLKSTYDLRGHVSRITAGLPEDTRDVLRNAIYDERSRLTQVDQGNDLRICSQYNRRDQATAVLVGKTAATTCAASDFSRSESGIYHIANDWGYDSVLERVADASAPRAGVPLRTASYDNDRLHQLTGATTALGNWQYDYDTVQNLTRVQKRQANTVVLDQSLTYGENAGPNAVTHVGATRLDYDSAGQLKSYKGYDLKFDALGRLVLATKPGVKTLQYYYDAGGERRLLIATPASGTREVYRYPLTDYEERQGDPVWLVPTPGALVEVRQAQGLRVDAALLDDLTAYVNAPAGKPKPLPQEWLDLDRDGDGFDAGDLALAQQAFWQNQPVGGRRVEWRFDQRDSQNSSIVLTDGVGDPVSTRHYEPYGATAQRTGLQPTFGYAGSEVEPDQDLGLIRMGARYYAPALGRWITPDRFVGEAPARIVGETLEASLYSYASNSPILRVDPSGLLPDDPADPCKNATYNAIIKVGTQENIQLMEAIRAAPNFRPKDLEREAFLRTWFFTKAYPGSAFQGAAGEAIVAAHLRMSANVTASVVVNPGSSLPAELRAAVGGTLPDILLISRGYVEELEDGSEVVHVRGFDEGFGPENRYGLVRAPILLGLGLTPVLMEVTTIGVGKKETEDNGASYGYQGILKRARKVAAWAAALPSGAKAMLVMDRDVWHDRLKTSQRNELMATVRATGGYIILWSNLRNDAIRVVVDTRDEIKAK